MVSAACALVFVLVVTSAPAAAEGEGKAAASGAGRLVASREPGWPQWRGPRRDGLCDETLLLQSWPEGGPRVCWTAGGIGRGYSSPIVTRGTIYVTGDVGDELHVFAFDLEGKLKWRSRNGAAWKGSHPGARACCNYDDGRLYHMNAHGRVACLDARTGEEFWAVNVLERFAGKGITWGLSECLLIDGPRVIVAPGGAKGLVAALDKKSAGTLWASQAVPGEKAGYASPILFELGGLRHLVGGSSRHLFGVDADSGKLLWTVPWPTRYEVIAATPVLCNDAVLVSSPDGKGGALYRLRVRGGEVRAEQVWTTPLDNMYGTLVLVGNFLYGSGHMNIKGWACLDVATGKTMYEKNDLAMGSAIYADGRVYCLGEQGDMALLKPTPGGFETAGRFSFMLGKHDVWPHPVICDGRMYLRYHDTLYCYDIKAK